MKQFIACDKDINYSAALSGANVVDTYTVVADAFSKINDTTDGLAVGSIAVLSSYTATGSSFDMGAPIATGTGISTLLAAGCESFKIALGRSANGAYLSNDIDITTLTIEYGTYSAGTAETITFVVPTITTVAADIGLEYTIVVDDLERVAQDIGRRKRYTHTIAAAGETQITIATALVALINADLGDSLASAANGGTATITFTAVVTKSNHVFGRGELTLVNGTKTAGTASTGSYAEMLALEKEASTERGKRSFNYLVSELYSSPSMLSAANTYNVIKLKWKQKDSDALAVKTQNPYQELTIATPVGAVIANLVHTTLVNILTT